MIEYLEDNKYKITYKDKSIVTTFYEEISDELYQSILDEYNKRPSKREVCNQLYDVSKGNTQLKCINDYYFKDLMDNTKVYYNNWSIKEFFECKDLVEIAIAKINQHRDFYSSEDSLYNNIKMCLRLGNKGVASNVYNFPIDRVNDILNIYNINNNYYDFSCGWGARLLSALAHNINYFGTDPNDVLCERLVELEKDYKKVNSCKSKVKIFNQGSECLIDELINTIGVAFSSPPYFCLEDYRIGNQSYKEGMEYDDWLNNYLKPTFENIRLYLIDSGYFIININDFAKYTLVKDTIEIATNAGFKYLGKHILHNNQRINEKKTLNDNSEGIFIFCKDTSNNTLRTLSDENRVKSNIKNKKLF